MPPLDLSAELPPPRDDEPSSLRQDIFDELADHLECSLHREQVKTGDEELARRNVIHKFGNPASIATKLWWDAMWEKIVMQRISFIMTVLTTAACIALVVLLWRSQSETREFLAGQASRQEAFLLSLAERLKSEPTLPAPAQLPEGWGDVKVRLIDADGQPVHGKVRLARLEAVPPRSPEQNHVPKEQRMVLLQETGNDGIAAFRGIPYGKVYLEVMATKAHSFNIWADYCRPGMAMIEKRCPTDFPQKNRVRFNLDVPEDLKDIPLLYEVILKREVIFQFDDQIWYRPDGPNWGMLDEEMGGDSFEESIHFLLDHTGQILGRLPTENDSSRSFKRAMLENDLLQAMPADEPLPPLNSDGVIRIVARVKSREWRGQISSKSWIPNQNVDCFAWIGTTEGRNAASYARVGISAGENGESLVEIGPTHGVWDLVREFQADIQLLGRKAQFDEQGYMIPVGSKPAQLNQSVSQFSERQ